MAEKRETGTLFRLVGLGMIAQTGLLLLIVAFLAWVSRPLATGQSDWEHSFLSWFTALVPAALLAAALFTLGRGFLREARGVDERGYL